MKSRWFKRLERDAAHISSHIRFKRIRNGFYRMFWDNGYIGECIEKMPENGYDMEDVDHRLEDRKYVQEKEADGDFHMMIKNFVEGYWESRDRLKTSAYQLHNDYEYYKTTQESYKTIRLK